MSLKSFFLIISSYYFYLEELMVFALITRCVLIIAMEIQSLIPSLISYGINFLIAIKFEDPVM